MLETIITTFGVLAAAGVAAGVSLYQINRTVSSPRSRIKHDIEILKLIEGTDIPCEELKGNVLRQLADLHDKTVVGKRRLWTPEVVGVMIVSVSLFIGFGAWTAFLVRDGFTWWSVLPGIMAFSGIGQSMTVIDESQRRKQKTRDPLSLRNVPGETELQSLIHDVERLSLSLKRFLKKRDDYLV